MRTHGGSGRTIRRLIALVTLCAAALALGGCKPESQDGSLRHIALFDR